MADENGAIRCAIVIEKFDKALHDRSAFSCGNATIDNFFKKTLSTAIKSGMVTTWVATKGGDPAVLGFYALAAFSVNAEHGPKRWRQTTVPNIPCIYISFVAVSKDLQSKGLGKALMFDAMRRCIRSSEQIGASAIILDVLEDDQYDRRWKFYADIGFRSLDDPEHERRVFMSMSDAKKYIETDATAPPAARGR